MGRSDKNQLDLFHSFAAVGPALAAFVTTYLFYGKQGIRNILYKLKPHIPSNRSIFLICSPLLFFILGILIFRIIKSDFYDFGNFAELNWSSFTPFTIWFLPLLTYSIFEEIGWRGFCCLIYRIVSVPGRQPLY